MCASDDHHHVEERMGQGDDPARPSRVGDVVGCLMDAVKPVVTVVILWLFQRYTGAPPI